MASIADKYIINNIKYDRRVKLTPEDKLEIHKVYKEGLFSQRELAKIYNVSRRSIQFAIDPKKLEESKKRLAERGGSKIYYNTEESKKAKKEHREYKNKLLKSGIKLKEVA